MSSALEKTPFADPRISCAKTPRVFWSQGITSVVGGRAAASLAYCW